MLVKSKKNTSARLSYPIFFKSNENSNCGRENYMDTKEKNEIKAEAV